MSDRDDRDTVDDSETRDTEARDTETRDVEAHDAEGRDTEVRDTEARDIEARDAETRDDTGDDDGGGLSGGLAVLIAALVGLAVAVVAYWWVGGWAGNEVFFEELYRVQPTVEGGGVGADWVTGNTVPWLDALIAIVHAADVLMGVMILAMVFLHWAIFRRLADRMQPPVERRTGEAVATDGGTSREDSGSADRSVERADGGGDDARGGDRP